MARLYILLQLLLLLEVLVQGMDIHIEDVRLLGSPDESPNAGRVQVNDRGEWKDVCHNGDDWGDKDWSITEAMVACGQLGYPGTAMKKKGGFGNGKSNKAIDAFDCYNDDKNLSQCNSTEGPDEENKCSNNNDAGVICTVPGYLGCYVDGENRVLPDARMDDDQMTIKMCKDFCINQSPTMRYAGVQNTRECFCGDEDSDYGKLGKEMDNECDYECGGNPNEICGGYWRISIYDLHKGKCFINLSSTKCNPREQDFSFGKRITCEDFQCDTGYKRIIGEAKLQCVLGDTPDDVAWSGEPPQCIKYADIRDISLQGSPAEAPNAGRIQINETDQWKDVCHDGDDAGDKDWSIEEAMVACRQLGYPGTAMSRKGGFENGTNENATDAFDCDGDENNLSKCVSSKGPDDRDSCPNNGNAGVICTVPGYLGCYVNDESNVLPDAHMNDDEMTIKMCTEFCSNQTVAMKYAGVQNSHFCYCGVEGTNYTRLGRVGDNECNMTCGGNQDEICGGTWRMSLYDIHKGKCIDPSPPNGTTVERDFSFGKWVKFVCETDYKLEGESRIQCVLGSSPDNCTWSGEPSQCIQYADIGDIRLLGSPDEAPNAGRVQVYGKGQWKDVCHNDTDGDAKAWGITEAMVACQQLGYPGTAMSRKGGYGNGNSQHAINAFDCNGDEKNLSQCVSSQGPNDKDGCFDNDDAGVVCTVPGYLGCYVDDEQGILPDEQMNSTMMTIDMCRKFCINHDHTSTFRYAGVLNSSLCFCGVESTNYTRLGMKWDNECDTPCAGNQNEMCGGKWRMSIYDLLKGECSDPTPCNGSTKEQDFSFGKWVTFVCDPDYELIGEPRLQCVLGDTPDECSWNGEPPYCEYLPATSPPTSLPATQPTSGESLSIGQISGVVVGSVLAVVLLLLLLIFVVRPRIKQTGNNPSQTKPLQFDGPYDLTVTRGQNKQQQSNMEPPIYTNADNVSQEKQAIYANSNPTDPASPTEVHQSIPESSTDEEYVAIYSDVDSNGHDNVNGGTNKAMSVIYAKPDKKTDTVEANASQESSLYYATSDRLVNPPSIQEEEASPEDNGEGWEDNIAYSSYDDIQDNAVNEGWEENALYGVSNTDNTGGDNTVLVDNSIYAGSDDLK